MGIHKDFKLNDEDLKTLKSELKKRNIPMWKHKRMTILLLLHKGKTYRQIQDVVQCQSPTIFQWKSRYQKQGLKGLVDKTRSGRPKKITAEIEAKVCTIVQGLVPEGKSHWSTSLLSKATGIAQRTVYDILQRNHLKPHLHKSFMVSNDPNFEEKASEIIGLYMNPPENAVVLCVDEKTAIQALNRLQPNLPLRPYQSERTCFEYERNGTTSLYAAFQTNNGKVYGDCSPSHTQYDFLAFLNKLDKKFKKTKEIHVILDNFRAHKTKKVMEWLTEHINWHFHFTPTYSSWLNQVECWFSIISRQFIRRGIFFSVKELIGGIKLFIREYNKECKPFKWTYDDVSHRIAI
jgi:transposase